jgi:hypothetical protein
LASKGSLAPSWSWAKIEKERKNAMTKLMAVEYFLME